MKRIRQALVVLAVSMAATAAPARMHAQAKSEPATAEAHKQWMDDASDLQEDLKDALQAKSGAKASEALTKIEAIMARTEGYWAAKKMDDVVKLAREARALAKEAATTAKAGKLDATGATIGKLNAACNTCHDLHPEKRKT